MDGEVLVAEVADVDGAGAVVGELVGAGAADAEGGVCAFGASSTISQCRTGAALRGFKYL